MNKVLAKLFSVLLTLCLVFNIAPAQVSAEEETPKIIIDQQTAGPLSGIGISDDTDSITITAHATNGKPVEYRWWIKYPEGTTVNLTQYNTSGDYVLTYDSIMPGDYEIFCRIKAEGCTEIQSPSINVKVNKAIFSGLKSGTLNVAANRDGVYTYDLPELAVYDMYYSVSGSAISTLVKETPLVYKDSTTLEWITSVKVSSQPVFTTATIEYKISGGMLYEDSSFSLNVVSGSVEIIGIDGENSEYSGIGKSGYTGTPRADGYLGNFNYYYEGRGNTSYSSKEKPINAGDYTVTISIPEGEDFIASKSINFSITKKIVTIKYMDLTLDRNAPLPEIMPFGMSYIGFVNEDNELNCLSVLPVPQYPVKDTTVPGVYTMGFLTEAKLNERGEMNYTLQHMNANFSISLLSGQSLLLDIGLPSAVIDGNSATATVDYSVSSYLPSIQVSEGASWSVVDGEADIPIPLKVGINEIKIKVISENTYCMRTYTLSIERLAEPTTAPTTPTTAPTTPTTTPTTPTTSTPNSSAGTGVTPTIPVYKAIGNEKSWDEIGKNIKDAKNGEVVIDMSATDTVPVSIIEIIAGTQTTVTFQFSDNISWRIPGGSLKALTESGVTNSFHDMNIKAVLGSGNIPKQPLADFKKQLSDKSYDLILLSLSHEGSFGFIAYLSLYLDIEKEGKTVNLFYYNPSTGKLEFQYAGKVDQKGFVEFPFTHASEYVLILDDGELLRAEIDKLTMTAKETLYIGGNTGNEIKLDINLKESLKELASEDALYPVITFSSSNSETATVTADGKVSAKKEGRATIKAIVKIGEVEKTLTTVITVKKAYINIVKKKTSLTLRDTYTYQAVGYGITADKITWGTTEKAIVVIKSDTGKAVAKSTGTDTVLAKYDSIRAKIKVTVKNK